MTVQDAQFRLPWTPPPPRGVGAHRSISATFLALGMAIIVMLVAGETQACRDSTVQGAITAIEEMLPVVKITTSVIHTIPPGMDLRRAHKIRATGTEGNVLGCCGTPHASGSGCSGANCTSCFTATVPTAIAAYIPGMTAGCRWVHVTRAAALSPASPFRPPRLDV